MGYPMQRLTPVEWEALELQLEGKTYNQIGLTLDKSVSTIRTQIASARRKIGVEGSGGSHRVVLRLQELGYLHRLPEPEPEPGPLTPAQLLYLDAFDRHLGGDPAARAEMTHMLGAMRIERRHL